MSSVLARILSFWLGFATLLAVVTPEPASAQTSGDRRDRRMMIINETGRVIRQFHATNSSIKSWGRDLLGSNVISHGQRYAIDFNDGTGSCQFDFRAVLDNGRAVERYGVDVCTATQWIVAPDGANGRAPGDRRDRRMVIVNATGRVIQEIHATNSGVKDWGRDLLGSKVISQGQRYTMDFDDGTGSCEFDFRAVLDNGRVVEQYGVDVCTAAQWIVSLASPILDPRAAPPPGRGTSQGREAASRVPRCCWRADHSHSTLVRLL